jgi:hypothetical protein
VQALLAPALLAGGHQRSRLHPIFLCLRRMRCLLQHVGETQDQKKRKKRVPTLFFFVCLRLCRRGRVNLMGTRLRESSHHAVFYTEHFSSREPYLCTMLQLRSANVSCAWHSGNDLRTLLQRVILLIQTSTRSS